MKQTTLSFSAAKRTGSASNIGKPTVITNTTFKSKPTATSTSSPVEEAEEDIKKDVDSSEPESDRFDDILTPEDTEDDEYEAVTDEIVEDDGPTKEELEALKRKEEEERAISTPRTRSQTKKVSTPIMSAKNSAQTNGTRTNSLPFKPSNLRPEDLAKRVEENSDLEKNEGEVDLDVKSKRWNKQYGLAKKQMSGIPAIHGEKNNKVHDILRVFDNTYEYGPCVGMTRLERWRRAEDLGLDPPKEIFEILTTKQGKEKDEYKETVFFGQVI